MSTATNQAGQYESVVIHKPMTDHRMVDPGAEGWAVEPKVTQAERLLYGERAGIVRLLGQAAVAAGDAYSLACKHDVEAVPVPASVTDPETGERGPVPQSWHDAEANRRKTIHMAHRLYEEAKVTAAEVARKAIQERCTVLEAGLL